MTAAAVDAAPPERTSGGSTTGSDTTKSDLLVRIGRIALGTQGVLYVVVGLIATRLATGDYDANPSQKGAIASVARQPFGRALLVILIVGLGTHAAWRLVLAIRGERGDDEDGGSVAKRIANVFRFGIYASFTYAAVRILGHADAGSGNNEKRGTAVVLGWPAGRWIVMGIGIGVLGAAAWNLRKAITRRFLRNLDLHTLDERKRRVVEILGTAGYLARAGAFGLVGWFLLNAGLHRDAGESRGLDDSLRSLASGSYGPPVLFALALGLILFGAFRVLDGAYRKESEILFA